MRVTHISVIHRPWDTRIFYKECRAMADAGHETHLVIGGPRDAQRVDGVHVHSISGDNGRPKARRQWLRMARATRTALGLRPSVYHLHDPHLIPLGLRLEGARRADRLRPPRGLSRPTPARSSPAIRCARAEGDDCGQRWNASRGRAFDASSARRRTSTTPFPPDRTAIVVSNYPLRRVFPQEPSAADRGATTRSSTPARSPRSAGSRS